MPANAFFLVGLAGFAAGFINAIAGGGTLLSFPALMHAGLPAINANATNTISLWPGSLASAWAYRKRIQDNRQLVLTLGLPSLLGGLTGAILLLTTPEKLFRFIVPFLLLLACGLLLLQEPVGRWLSKRATLHPRRHAVLLWLVQLAIGIYGGYFGAGIGIMMLAAMAIFLPEDLQTANALKTLLAAMINGAAALYFVFSGAIDYRLGVLMGLAAIAGGYIGAHAAQRLNPRPLRYFVVAYGLIVAGKMWWES